ncbi:hypothetical protein EBT31_13610 [bacterium]|nr:hypothetical protein [bacterium]NBX49089.1 hypothetical protein [bacterium]
MIFMQPYIIDIIFGVLALVLFAYGWRKGFVRMAGGMVSLVVSVVAGIWGVEWIEDVLGIPLSATFFGLIFAFLTIAVIVSAMLNLVVTLLDLLRRLLTMIPGVGFIHRVAGAFVGVLEAGALLLAVAYLSVYVLSASDIRTLLLSSQAIGYATRVLEAVVF